MKKINVCYASSNEYAPYTGISLFSCLENNADIIDTVYILSFGILEENRLKLKEVVENRNCGFVFVEAIPIMKPIFESINLDTFRGSYATYARAFISYLIPEEVDRLLYIDSDTIVDGSLKEIADLDLDSMDKVYAAVIGTNHYFSKDNPETKLDNGNRIYFQAGIIFFNLNLWRKYGCTEMIEDYIKHHGSSYPNADQTVINNVIEQKYVHPLHPKFNYWGHIYRGPRLWYQMRLGEFWDDDTIKEAIDHPVIIHYKGYIVHPWRKDSISSLYDRYHSYKPLTPWKDDVEYSINYDFSLGRISQELVKINKDQLRNLRYHPNTLKLRAILSMIKHFIIK